jgi:DNA polymerase I-like protein with 3'-5' exonuclease and polymerase domains
MTNYCETQSQVDEALHEILKYSIAGLDTEFYGCDITSESPVGRSICHVFSVAVPSGPLNPRGYNGAESWVFAASALGHAGIKEWLEDRSYAKAVHNQPVDHHTLRNHGVKLRGGINTLAMARFWYPSRAKREGFDLDSLGRDYCGAGKTESFDGLLGYDAIEVREHEVTKKRCECGVLSCMKKKMDSDFQCHTIKTPERVVAPYNVKVRRFIPLADLHPAHPLWARYMAYAAWDAVLALQIYQLMLRDKIERPYPWSLPI